MNHDTDLNNIYQSLDKPKLLYAIRVLGLDLETCARRLEDAATLHEREAVSLRGSAYVVKGMLENYHDLLRLASTFR